MAGGVCIGIDVSKASPEVAFGSGGELRSVANEDRAIAQLAVELRAPKPELVVMEASGGYERMSAALLWEAGLPIVIANPRQIRQFCQGMGEHAKTDRRDAQMIALRAEHKRPAVRRLPDAQERELIELLMRRRQTDRDAGGRAKSADADAERPDPPGAQGQHRIARAAA